MHHVCAIKFHCLLLNFITMGMEVSVHIRFISTGHVVLPNLKSKAQFVNDMEGIVLGILLLRKVLRPCITGNATKYKNDCGLAAEPQACNRSIMPSACRYPTVLHAHTRLLTSLQWICMNVYMCGGLRSLDFRMPHASTERKARQG